MMIRPARHLPDGGMARGAVPFCRGGGLEGFAAPLYRCGFGHLAGKAGHRSRAGPPLGERPGPAPPRRTRHPSSIVRLFAGTAPTARG